MSFTVAYALRLACWGLLLATLASGLVWTSWRLTEAALARADPAIRHRTAVVHFMALAALPLAATVGVHLALAGMGSAISRGPAAEPLLGLTPNFTRYVAGILMLIWLGGFLIHLWRFWRDACAVRSLVTKTAPNELTDDVHRLTVRAGIRQNVSVRTADIVSPQVTGIWSIVLVVPLEFPDLGAEQREAVLLHELAHVFRRDFFHNLLQRIVLAIIWFQPAARHLYRSIVVEREACCDRLAIRNGASVTALARSLLHLAVSSERPRAIVMTISGNGSLRRRIQTMISPDNSIGKRTAWSVRAFMIATFAATVAIGTQSHSWDHELTDLYVASTLGPTISIDAEDPAGRFSLRVRHGRVVAAAIGKRAVARSNIRQRGEHASLTTGEGGAPLKLRVNPHGRIQWKARSKLGA